MKKITFPKTRGEQMMIEFRDVVLAGHCPPIKTMEEVTLLIGAEKGAGDPRIAWH